MSYIYKRKLQKACACLKACCETKQKTNSHFQIENDQRYFINNDKGHWGEFAWNRQSQLHLRAQVTEIALEVTISTVDLQTIDRLFPKFTAIVQFSCFKFIPQSAKCPRTIQIYVIQMASTPAKLDGVSFLLTFIMHRNTTLYLP